MFLKFFRSTTSLTDAQCLATYKHTGDLSVLGQLYERNMEMVFAVCYKYLRHEEEAKDAVMQIFEQLIADLRTHDVHNFKSWLHSVARNYCLMQLRVQKIMTPADEIEEQVIAENTLPVVLEDYTLDHQLNNLGDCMQKLNTPQRRSVELFYLQQFCYQQIVTETGYSLNEVKSYIQNGKRNLKLCLEGKEKREKA